MMSPTRARVFTLLSGVARERRRKRIFVVFQAFVDNSYDKHIHVLAGYIATVDGWMDFSDDWRTALKEAGLPAFKMSKIATIDPQFKLTERFYRIAERHVAGSVSCVVDIDALAKVLREVVWPINVFETEKLNNPYYLAFFSIINHLPLYQEAMGIEETVDFIFDIQNEQENLKGAWWEAFRMTANEEQRKFFGAMPRFERDEDFEPLQAADLLAWWRRKWENEGAFSIPDGKIKFPWSKQRDFPNLNIQFREFEIREHFERLVHDKRATFVARLPDQVIRQLAEAQEYQEKQVATQSRESIWHRLRQWIKEH
jgi:hypothetical protein